MEFELLAIPKNDLEAGVITGLLETSQIPHYVHNRSLGSLYPGFYLLPQARVRIMVATEHLEEARALLTMLDEAPPEFEFEEGLEPEPEKTPTPPKPALQKKPRTLTFEDKVRLVFKFFLTGQFLKRTAPKDTPPQ